MKKLRKKRMPKKITESMEKSKTRQKIMELSHNLDVLPFKMRCTVGEIRQGLGFDRNITLEDIKTIDKTHRWYKKHEREQ